MIKTPLETRLEDGLFELGSELSERMYFEDIIMAAQIDDVFGEMTLAEAEAMTGTMDEDGNPGIVDPAKLTPNQRDLFYERDPVFKRTASINNIQIQYKLIEWGSEGDDPESIILKGNYHESIEIRAIGTPGEVEIETSPEFKDGAPDYDSDKTEVSAMHGNLNDDTDPVFARKAIALTEKFPIKEYSPREVAEAVIEFARYENE